MAGLVRVVTRSRPVAEMPQWTPEYVDLTQFVAENDLLKEMSERLRFGWRRGYGMLDLAVFFLALACGHASGGIRGFRKQINGCSKRLAACAGRDSLMTSASVSRSLQAADRIADLDVQVAWLLSEGAQVENLVRSPVVQTRDTLGQAWTVLDFDPTVTALRQRALPQGDDLPPARRRAAPLCAPGYSGRHRGETQVSTAVLSHTGAGLFVQATTQAGNTLFAPALGIACDAGAALVDRCKLSRAQTLIRFDGAGGHAKAMSEVTARRLHFLTRLANLALLTDPAVVAHLAQATWSGVADSRSGPRREATELGDYIVGSDNNAQSVTARLVISRFACPDGVKHGAGTVQDGWHYEVYATSLAATAWPAADTVTLYYGRCGQENQFGQAIKSIRLGEVYCYDLQGQRLATALMMWISNLRMTRSAAYVGELGQPPKQQERIVQPAPALEAEVQASETNRTEMVPKPLEQQPDPQPEPMLDPTQPEACNSTSAMEQHSTANEAVADVLPCFILCPSGLSARLSNIRRYNRTGCHAIYRMQRSACSTCVQRSGCTDSKNPVYSRQFPLALASEMLAFRGKLLAEVRAGVPPERRLPVTVADPSQQPKGRPKQEVMPAPVPTSPPSLRWTMTVHQCSGPLEPASPALRPSELLRQWRNSLCDFAIEVRINRPKEKRSISWLSANSARRQCRRYTWHERQQWAALRGTATVIRRPRTDDSLKPKTSAKSIHH